MPYPIDKSISYDFVYNNKTLVFKKLEVHSC